jgi:hypothetical protein
MSMRVIVFWFILIMPCFVQAQISMEDFLLASLEEPEIKSFSQQENYLKSKPFRLAPIRQLEFRTESNQLDPERQDYALRINPSNPWEVKRNKEYFQSYQELLQLDRNRLLRESLRTRYEVIIGWVYYQEISVLKGEDKQTTEKLLSILEGQRFSTYFDADDYVELKLEQVDRALEVEETKFEIDNQRRRVEGLYENAKLNTLEWPYTAVISLEKLVSVVDSLMQQQTTGGEVSYREKQIDLANREWLLEKNNINLGFLQAQYEEFRTEQGRSPWSVSLGVTIPVFNPNKGDMTKRKLEVLEAQGDLDEAKVEQNSGRELAYRKIKSLMQRHHDITTMMQELNVGTLSTTLQQINDSNPTAMIRLQRNLIKLKTMATRLKQEIYLSYVEFLYYAEVLQQQPLLNYLSPTLTTLTAAE